MIKFARYFFLPSVVSKRLPFYEEEKQMFEKEHYHRDNCNAASLMKPLMMRFRVLMIITHLKLQRSFCLILVLKNF